MAWSSASARYLTGAVRIECCSMLGNRVSTTTARSQVKRQEAPTRSPENTTELELVVQAHGMLTIRRSRL